MRDPEKILADDPGSVVFSRYAEQLAREGRIEQAVEVLKRGIQANPFHAPGYSVLAEILFQLESEEEAVENIMSALRLDPQMPRDLFRLGTHYLDQDPSKAVPLLKAAGAYEPDSEDVAASFEKARLLAESYGDDGEASSEANSATGNAQPADGCGIRDFGERDDASLTGENSREPLRKPSVRANQEDRDFLALMGEPNGGTIDEELDSLFQSLESGAGKAASLAELAPEEKSFDEIMVSAKASDGESRSGLKPVVPEKDRKDRADEAEEEEIEPSTYTRPFDERPLDTLDDDDLSSEEAVSPDFYDKQLVEEVEEQKDFFNAITEYGAEGAESDLDTVFESLAKDRNLDIPLPELEESDLEGADAERRDADVGSEPGPEDLPSGGLDEVPGEEPPAGYGIVDLEKEAEVEGILEITDEEEYDLARFGYESAPEEEPPVLSDAERTELMALSVPSEDMTEEDGGEKDCFSLGELTLEDLEKPEHTGTDEGDSEPSGGADPAESRGTPVSAANLPEVGEDLVGEGIDYSDILSSWKIPGGVEPQSSSLEPEPLSISDILENLADHSAENSGEVLPSFPPPADEPETPSSPEPANEPEIRDEVEPELAGPEIIGEGALSVSEPETGELPVESPVEDENGEPLISSGGTSGDFALPMMDGLFDMGNPFHPLTEDQAALIDDFISGKEPEAEPEFGGELYQAPEPVERAESPESAPLDEGSGPAAEITLPEFTPSPEDGAEAEAYGAATETGEMDPVIGGDRIAPVSTGIEVSDVYGATAESPAVAEPAMPTAKPGRGESLDDLISLYQEMLDRPAPRVARAITPTPVPAATPPTVPKPASAREPEPKARNAAKPLGSYTATMAEIYVSQGLIARAMEIYTVLADENPENATYRQRLAELKRMLEQQSDLS